MTTDKIHELESYHRKCLFMDLLCLLVANLLCLWVFSEFDTLEWLFHLSREKEDWEIDEILPLSFTLAISLGIFSIRRIRENRQTIRLLTDYADHDSLTGLLNRHAFDQVLDIEVSRAARDGSPLALIMADIDHFKDLNDKYGHIQGDKVLEGFADILRSNIRNFDIAVRWGGEEFVILCPNTDLHGADAVAQKLRECIEAHEFLPGHPVTASFGVCSNAQVIGKEQLFALVDKALYQAKNAGRNRVCVLPQV